MSKINNVESLYEDGGWGFYVDIENQYASNCDNYRIMDERYNRKKYMFCIALENISEDCEYYSPEEKNLDNFINQSKNGANVNIRASMPLSSVFIILFLIYLALRL